MFLAIQLKDGDWLTKLKNKTKQNKPRPNHLLSARKHLT
jgi:hypothetical protein